MTARTGTGDDARVAELCERLRQLAHQAGEGALHTARQRAEALVAEARERAHEKSREQIARVKDRLARKRERELQIGRLEARAQIAWGGWKELDVVVDAAERQAESLRDTEPHRYLDALRRFLGEAREALPGRALTVHARADDLDRLRRAGVKIFGESELAEIVDPDVKAGLRVTSADGNVLVDQTIVGRRQRLDEQLRLAAAEVLFDADAEVNSPRLDEPLADKQ
jgi:vacuolar-type H+-ATPase subunit E/Vma4